MANHQRYKNKNRFRHLIVFAVLLPVLVACGGGGSSGRAVVPGGGSTGGGSGGGSGSSETRVATASAVVDDSTKGEFISYDHVATKGIRGRYVNTGLVELQTQEPRRVLASRGDDHPIFKSTTRTLDFNLAPNQTLRIAIANPLRDGAISSTSRVDLLVKGLINADGSSSSSNITLRPETLDSSVTTVTNQTGISIPGFVRVARDSQHPVEAYVVIDANVPASFAQNGVARQYNAILDDIGSQGAKVVKLEDQATGNASSSSRGSEGKSATARSHRAQDQEEYLASFDFLVTRQPTNDLKSNLAGLLNGSALNATLTAEGITQKLSNATGLSLTVPSDLLDLLTYQKDTDTELLKAWIKSQPEIYGVAENRTFSARAMSQRDNAQVTDIYENEAINSHLHTLNAAELIEASNFGDGLTVCINDNAVNFDGSDIPMPAAQHDFSNDDASVSTESEDIHGSYVASMMLASPDNDGLFGFAHNARYLHAQVLGGDQSAEVLVAGMEWCIDNGADIINQSLGFDTDVGHEYAVGFSPKVDAWREAGGVIFQASGNSLRLDDKLYNSGEVGYVIVGATNRDYEFASFSNYGQELDVAAIGVAVPGFSHVANKGTENERDVFEYIDGTSFSTPLVASVYAAVRSVNPNFDGYWLDRVLQSGDVTINEEELVGYMGNGALDADALYHAAKDLPASAGHLFATKYALHAVYDGASISFDLLSPDADVTVADISAPSIVGLTIDMEDDVDRGRVVVTLTADNIATLKTSLNGAGQVNFSYGADSLPIRITGLFNADTVTASYPGEYFVVTHEGSLKRIYFLDNHGISSNDGVDLSIAYRTDDTIDALDAVYICRQLTADKDEVAPASHCADITSEYNAGYMSDALNEHIDIVLRRGVYSPISE